MGADPIITLETLKGFFMAAIAPTTSDPNADPSAAAATPAPTVDNSAGTTLLTDSTFAKELSPSAAMKKTNPATQTGFYNPADPSTIDDFEATQKKNNDDYLAKIAAQKAAQPNYAATDENGNFKSWEDSNAPGFTDNQTAYNYEVTNQKTLGTTVAFNDSLSAYSGSSSAYATATAAVEADAESKSGSGTS